MGNSWVFSNYISILLNFIAIVVINKEKLMKNKKELSKKVKAILRDGRKTHTLDTRRVYQQSRIDRGLFFDRLAKSLLLFLIVLFYFSLVSPY
jgi:hypothetical protein